MQSIAMPAVRSLLHESDFPTEEEAGTLEAIMVTASVFSFIGSMFILICYWKFPDLRSMAFKLVALLSFSDLFNSIAGMMGDAGGNESTWVGAHSALCTIQGIMLEYFGVCSLLWNGSIAYTLHRAFLLNDEDYSAAHIHTKMKKYLLVCFGVPLFLTLLPLFSSSYGDTGGWCGIIYSSWGIAWRYITFYLICWAVVGYNTYVYVRVYRKAKEMNRLDGEQQNNKLLSRIKYYPLVLILCWAWASVDILVLTVTGGQFILWLQGLHIWFSTIQGFFNACVYGLTPTVRQKVRLMCFGDSQQVMSQDESQAEDIEFTKFTDIQTVDGAADGGGI